MPRASVVARAPLNGRDFDRRRLDCAGAAAGKSLLQTGSGLRLLFADFSTQLQSKLRALGGQARTCKLTKALHVLVSRNTRLFFGLARNQIKS